MHAQGCVAEAVPQDVTLPLCTSETTVLPSAEKLLRETQPWP